MINSQFIFDRNIQTDYIEVTDNTYLPKSYDKYLQKYYFKANAV